MPGGTSISLRFRDALGSGGWRGVGPLCIRALRARLNGFRRREANTTYTFDEQFGVHTHGITRLAMLQIDSPQKQAGVRYEPTDPNAFRKMITHIPADVVARATFIDVGCGRGRVLLLAAQHGFTNIVGIDFAEELCHAARSNIEKYISQSHTAARFSVEQVDACAYRFPPEPMVIFLYNPFNEAVMARFVSAVEQSLNRAPRIVYVIYSLPFWRKPWDSSSTFKRSIRTSIWTKDWFVVYRHA